jgi:SAM-dependent methyltransferase
LIFLLGFLAVCKGAFYMVMRKISRRLVFNLSYLFKPRWDTGIPAPEIVRFIHGKTPGSAIDIGCGTGTNLLYLAEHHWQVTGIDYAPLAVRAAHRKLKRYSSALIVADASKLSDLVLPGPYDLGLDMGCFHSLSDIDRAGYIRGLEKWIKPGGMFMLYAFQPSTDHPRGIPKQELLAYFKNGFYLVDYEQGHGRPSAWYYFEEK